MVWEDINMNNSEKTVYFLFLNVVLPLCGGTQAVQVEADHLIPVFRLSLSHIA